MKKGCKLFFYNMLSLKLSFHDKCIGNIPKTKKKIVQKYAMTNYMVAPLKEFGFI